MSAWGGNPEKRKQEFSNQTGIISNAYDFFRTDDLRRLFLIIFNNKQRMGKAQLAALVSKPMARAGMFFLLAFLFFYLHIEEKLYWDIFSTRDLQRALAWMKGQFHWPGPEMSAGNNLPGPFFYFLLMPPLLFPGGIYSNSVLWFTAWLALTYTLIFYFVEKTTKHKESLFIFLILFITSMGYSLFEPFNFGRNAGFAVLFHILALMGLYNYKQTNKNSHLYFVGLTLALGVQTHLLVLVHAITAICIFCLQKKRQLKVLLLFLLLSFLPFLIYILLDYFQIFSVSEIKWQYLDHIKESFLDKTSGRNFKKNFTVYLFFAFFILILMQYKKWKRNGQQWTGNKQLISGQMKDLLIVTAVPLFVFFLGKRYFWYLYSVPGIFLLLLSKQFDDLLSFGLNSSRKTGLPPDRLSHRKFIYVMVCGAAACILSPYKYVTHFKLVFTQNYNYPVIFSFAVLILLLTVRFVNPQNRKIEYGKTGILFGFLFCLSLIHVTTPPPVRHIKKSFSLTKKLYPSYQEMYPLMKRIFLETAWPAKSAMKHLYSTKMHFEISLLSYYSMTMEKIKKMQTEGLKDSFELPQTGNLKDSLEPPQTENLKDSLEPPQTGNLKDSLKSPQTGGLKDSLKSPQTGSLKDSLKSPQTGNLKNSLEPPQTGSLKDSLKSPQPGNLKQTSETPDGYMIIPHSKEFSDYSPKDWSQYLSNGPLLSPFLRRETAEKKILIKNSRLFGRYWLISYHTTEESYFPEGFHNTGQHYYWEEPEWLKKCKATKSFRDKKGFYYCMVLTGYKQRGGVEITLSKNTGAGFLNLFFYGPLIGLSKDDTNLDGYALWSNIQLKVECDDGMFRRALPNIGLNYADQERPHLVAPLKLRVPVSEGDFSCGKITKMEMTFNLLYDEHLFIEHPLKKIKIVW